MAYEAPDFYDVDSLLTEEERVVRDTVRGWVEERVMPDIGRHFEDGTLPEHTIREMGEMATIYHAPRHPSTRMLFSATPDLLGDDDVKSIPGAPPRLDRELAGCPFAPRCDSTFAPCTTTHPRRLEIEPGHEAICHLNDRVVVEEPA